MTSEEKDGYLTACLKTDHGRAWLAFHMAGAKGDFEVAYAEMLLRREAEERARLRRWRAIPLWDRVRYMAMLQWGHRVHFGRWHPDGFIGPVLYGRSDR